VVPAAFLTGIAVLLYVLARLEPKTPGHSRYVPTQRGARRGGKFSTRWAARQSGSPRLSRTTWATSQSFIGTELCNLEMRGGAPHLLEMRGPPVTTWLGPSSSRCACHRLAGSEAGPGCFGPGRAQYTQKEMSSSLRQVTAWPGARRSRGAAPQQTKAHNYAMDEERACMYAVSELL